MGILKIHLFGQLEVHRGEELHDSFPSRKSRDLFCYLALRRQYRHPRQSVANILWGDYSEEQARRCLRTELWRMRTYIEPEKHEGQYIISAGDRVGFNPHSEYWLDVEEFEDNVSNLYTLYSPQIIEKKSYLSIIGKLAYAVGLYRGDLLEGCYEDWCIAERERLESLQLDTLTKLMEIYGTLGVYDEAIRFGSRIIAHDPLMEHIHRELMTLYYLAGNRGAALRQYDFCHNILARELDVDPMDETVSIRDIIRGKGSLDFRVLHNEVGAIAQSCNIEKQDLDQVRAIPYDNVVARPARSR
jgi:DNA-binding SARP family transcriptional activator